MNKFLTASLLGILLITDLFAQSRITGKVISEKDGAALPFASVFLSQTTLGDRTTEQGSFSINKIPNGRYELIVSYLGYEALVVPVMLQDTSLTFTLKLKPKTGQLSEVIIRKDPQRESWLRVFRQTFLGAGTAAASCKILNDEIINIQFDHSQRLLTAESDGMLEIENPVLGYRIKYLLQGYVNDYKQNYVLYYGFPQFQEMKAKNSRQQKRWEARRLTAYRGSSLHFMRSLMAKQLEADGFKVNKVVRQVRSNTPEPREPGDTLPRQLINPRQTFGPRYADYLYTGAVSYDSLFHQPAQQKGMVLHFRNYLQVIYQREKEPLDYAQSKGRGTGQRYPQTSMVHLFVPTVGVDENGNVEAPADLVYEGYWAWEKVAEMVPLDYRDNGK
ncbi:carboxypeptidase-like regulatory domain-containing protein [uncultured Chitinophaga sp.]|uniref:carboxypeptidase-like regulatory domain-containing protein n=1 Tax=uncultured Chitinophaga sp. TaxID=339340 RepID=UPI0025F3A6FC|nr:carboxypeptidase-like regulatory domain-containing protein [uncultured Chitinophaga sp.]